MKLTEEINENNLYIKTFKNILLWLITNNKLIYDYNEAKYTLSKESDDIRELASKQLKILDETRPNKEKSMYSQANQQQKEFIDFLEQVIIYGNVEGKDNVNIRNHTL